MMLPGSSPSSAGRRGGRSVTVRPGSTGGSGGAADASTAGLFGRRATSAPAAGGRSSGGAGRLAVGTSAVEGRAGAGTGRGGGAGAGASRRTVLSGRGGGAGAGASRWTVLSGRGGSGGGTTVGTDVSTAMAGGLSGSRVVRAPSLSGVVVWPARGQAASPAVGLLPLRWTAQSDAPESRSAASTIAGPNRRTNTRLVASPGVFGDLAPEVVEHLPDGAWPLGWVGGQRLLECAIDARGEPACWPHALEQFLHQACVGVDVTSLGGFFAGFLLRGEMGSRERWRVEIELTQEACRECAVLQTSQPDALLRTADLDVGRDDVSVNEPDVVCRLDRFADPDGQMQGPAEVRRRIRRQQLGEGSPLDEIGDQQEVTLRGVLDGEHTRQGRLLGRQHCQASRALAQPRPELGILPQGPQPDPYQSGRLARRQVRRPVDDSQLIALGQLRDAIPATKWLARRTRLHRCHLWFPSKPARPVTRTGCP